MNVNARVNPSRVYVALIGSQALSGPTRVPESGLDASAATPRCASCQGSHPVKAAYLYYSIT